MKKADFAFGQTPSERLISLCDSLCIQPCSQV